MIGLLKNIVKYLLYLKLLTDLYHYLIFKLFGIKYSSFPLIYGRIVFICKGTLTLGSNVSINSGKQFNPIGGDTCTRFIVENKNAKLTIGNNVGISNSTIFCCNSIIIEDEVLIGGSCKIYDTDFHSVNASERIEPFTFNNHGLTIKTNPIIIKKRAWIGGHCIILKGVTIGTNSVVGAGSVVTKSIPDNEIWAGNPAKFLKKINTL